MEMKQHTLDALDLTITILFALAIAIWLKSAFTEPPRNESDIAGLDDDQHTSSHYELEKWQEPCATSSTKSYMYLHSITSTTSKQFRLVVEHMNAVGGLMYDGEGNIGVALGSWWGEVGSVWTIELSSGKILRVVKIDEKADQHVINGCQHKVDGSVIEFVIEAQTNEYEYGSNGFILSGNFNNHIDFNGDIIRVRKEGVYE